jgi:ABC-2 type transport system ATP-binding protein
MIQINQLSKVYGSKRAVDNIDFTVTPGLVTGFLGPNGAGKSTTMRMIVGLDRPTSGSVTIRGQRYQDFRTPLQEVGALLEAKAVHPGRSAYNHLLAMALSNGIARSRVKEVIDQTGLSSVAYKRVGEFSLGMGQRLGLAAALLGDPEILMLDEPVNGLDPDGVLWVRQFARDYAAQGRTVFLSSHLMSEMAQTADHLIVLGRGKILADAPIAEIIARANTGAVRVATIDPAALATALTGPGVKISSLNDRLMEITGLTTLKIAEIAHRNNIMLTEMTLIEASLEDAYLALTRNDLEYLTKVSS